MFKNSGIQLRADLWLLGIYIATIPFTYRYGNLALIPIALYWLGTGKFKDSYRITKESLNIKLFLLLFTVILLSILTSENVDNQFTFIERYSCLLGLPVAFSSFKLSRRGLDSLLMLFVGVCSLCAVYSLISTFVVYELSPKDLVIKDNLSYYSWALPTTLKLRSNYYSLFIGFCLVIVAEKILQKSRRVYQILFLLLFCFLFVFLGLLSSRTSFFAVVFLFIFYLSKLIFQNKFRVGKPLIVGIALITLIIVSLQFPFLQSKIGGVLYGGTESDPRYILFKCGWKIFSENFLFGVGICDIRDVALKCYGAFDDVEAIQNQYNFHNVFLQLGASTGILGLAVFIALLVALFLQAIKTNRMVHIGFIFLFTLACMTESLLSRHKGLIFFTTFATLLFIQKPHEENPAR